MSRLFEDLYQRFSTAPHLVWGYVSLTVAISAGIVDGARATGSLGIKDDLENAGATWVDKAAFRDGNLVWGRVVPDIPDFCRELVAALAEE